MVSSTARKALRDAPPAKTLGDVDKSTLRNVVADWDGKWLCFPNMDIAKQVMPMKLHYKIYPDHLVMREKLGVRGMVELGKKYGVSSDLELWGKLQLNAYDPTVKYADIAAAEAQHRKNPAGVPRVKRYKRKIDYKFQFDPTSDAHMQVYGRLPPQACALLDIMHAGLSTCKDPNVYREDELRGLLELKKDELHTKQDSWRIFQYYRGTLIGRGFLRFHREKS